MTHIEGLTTFVDVDEGVQDGGVAQMVERMLSMHEAQGSIPCSSTLFVVLFCLLTIWQAPDQINVS